MNKGRVDRGMGRGLREDLSWLDRYFWDGEASPALVSLLYCIK